MNLENRCNIHSPVAIDSNANNIDVCFSIKNLNGNDFLDTLYIERNSVCTYALTVQKLRDLQTSNLARLITISG